MDQLGKYRVLRRIGAGGFGVVYEGYDPAIRRRVAIKTCTSADPRVRLRFTREAEITGNLSHPNIVVMYDYGEIEGNPFLVQEFLVGEDLDVKIARRDPLPLETKLSYLIQIADALCHAHQQGVVHRDVKPSNVRVLDTGVVKVMDFGIAWIKNHESITLTGRTVGTAAYMAPEQLRNEPVGPRADIFSFGVMAYELLTYERAFAGDSPSQVLYQVLNVEPVPIRARSADVPAELAALIAGCHRKDPDERYRSLDALIPAMRHLELKASGDESALTPPPRPLRITTAPPATSSPRAQPASFRSSELTAPLRPPPPPVPAAAHLDHVVLRGGTSRTTTSTGVFARSAAVGPSRRMPLAIWLAALAVVALVTTAVVRWQSIEAALRALASSGAASEPASGEAEVAAQPSTPEPAADEPAPAPRPTASPRPGPSRVVPQPSAPRPEPQRPPEDRQAQSAVAPAPSTALAPADAGRSDARPAPRRRAAPAALSVRASLGAPQGWVWLDGRPLGRTPIRRVPVASGRHRLQVGSAAGDASRATAWELEIASGQEHILTIDPTSGARPHEVRRPLASP